MTWKHVCLPCEVISVGFPVTSVAVAVGDRLTPLVSRHLHVMSFNFHGIHCQLSSPVSLLQFVLQDVVRRALSLLLTRAGVNSLARLGLWKQGRIVCLVFCFQHLLLVCGGDGLMHVPARDDHVAGARCTPLELLRWCHSDGRVTGSIAPLTNRVPSMYSNIPARGQAAMCTRRFLDASLSIQPTLWEEHGCSVSRPITRSARARLRSVRRSVDCRDTRWNPHTRRMF